MTDEEITEMVENEFINMLEDLANKPSSAKMKASDGFRLIAWIYRCNKAKEVTIDLPMRRVLN